MTKRQKSRLITILFLLVSIFPNLSQAKQNSASSPQQAGREDTTSEWNELEAQKSYALRHPFSVEHEHLLREIEIGLRLEQYKRFRINPPRTGVSLALGILKSIQFANDRVKPSQDKAAFIKAFLEKFQPLLREETPVPLSKHDAIELDLGVIVDTIYQGCEANDIHKNLWEQTEKRACKEALPGPALEAYRDLKLSGKNPRAK